MTPEEERELRAQLARLQQEHRDLDAAIAALQESPGADVIQVQRLKKRKLQLRDRITSSRISSPPISSRNRLPHAVRAVVRRSALRAYIAASARASTSAGKSSAPSSTTPADAPTTRVERPQVTGVEYTALSSAAALSAAAGPLTFHNSTTNSSPPMRASDVRSAHMLHQCRRDCLEHGIARGVAVAVVDLLEAIEIEIEQRRTRAVALDVGERALEFALEAAAVEGVGERVDVNSSLKFDDARPRCFELRREPVDLGRKPHRDRARPRLRLRRLRFVRAAPSS